jgi:hypothetical protein
LICELGIGLRFTRTSTGLSVMAPPDHEVAPAGWYLLSRVSAARVPSIATLVQP